MAVASPPDDRREGLGRRPAHAAPPLPSSTGSSYGNISEPMPGRSISTPETIPAGVPSA
ncbi:hypothetical protein [Streptomyces sp. NPDC002133]|uniref:hypothetical protein n=1 Tax=Streptomyces sp. NPDC002133 TaxID=3154409 RepID=UPI003324579A